MGRRERRVGGVSVVVIEGCTVGVGGGDSDGGFSWRVAISG